MIEIRKERAEKTQHSAAYRVVRIFQTIFTYLLAACILGAAILFAMDNSPQKSLFGFRYYTVLTPSMEPELSVGDVVLVKLANAEDIEVGDVITFNPSSDDGAYLTHRVTEKFEDYEGTGVTCYRTKGDANDSEDSFLIEQDRVIGTVVLHIPKIGYFIRFVQLRWYFVIPLVLLLGVFFYLMKLYFRRDLNAEAEEDEGKISEK